MPTQILIADGSSEWCDALVAALGDDAASAKITKSGTELEAALFDPRLKVIVVGDGLSGPSGLDALYLASKKAKTLTGPSKDEKRAIVLALLDVRHDVALMELIRARGVKGFLRRGAPPEELAAQIRNCLYVDSRVAPREPLKAKGTLALDSDTVSVTIEDLSRGGALVVGSARKLRAIAVGTELRLRARLYELALEVRVVVRRVELRKALLGDHLAIGVSFAGLDFAQEKTVETILDSIVADRDAGTDRPPSADLV